jgi:hypothetical protein
MFGKMSSRVMKLTKLPSHLLYGGEEMQVMVDYQQSFLTYE